MTKTAASTTLPPFEGFQDIDRLMSEVNILLLSDLHFDVVRDTVDPKTGQSKGELVIEKLIASLPPAHDHWQPDILILAGDLVNQNNENSYTLFFKLIDGLTGKYSQLRHAVFSTPGNHDINRDNMVSSFNFLYTLRKKYPGKKLQSSYTGNAIADTVYTLCKENWSTETTWSEHASEFEREYFKTYLEKKAALVTRGSAYQNSEACPESSLQTFFISSLYGINLASINSSFFCNICLTANDRNHLFFMNHVIEKIGRTVTNRKAGYGDLPVISFMHHPYYYMHESEHNYPAYPGSDLNPYVDPSNNFVKLAKFSDLVLSGHVHGELQNPSSLQRLTHLITNGPSFVPDSLWDKWYPCTYAIIKVNKQLRKFAVRKYKFVSDQFGCSTDDDFQFYHLFDKPGRVPTTMETEKVRVLESFFSLSKHGQPLTIIQFLLYQLRWYDQKLKEISEFEVMDESPAGRYPFKGLTIHSKNGLHYRIFLLNNKEDIQNMKAFLAMSSEDFPANENIYFSIHINLVRQDQAISTRKVEFRRGDYQTDLLSAKKIFISPYLLYHDDETSFSRSKTPS